MVDDDIVTQKILEYCLKDAGYDVKIANNGDEASRLLQLWNPELLITDVLMPHVNGIVLVSFIRNELKLDIPCIVISVLGQSDNVEKALEVGATAYIVKPIDTAELLDLIAKYRNDIP